MLAVVGDLQGIGAGALPQLESIAALPALEDPAPYDVSARGKVALTCWNEPTAMSRSAAIVRRTQPCLRHHARRWAADNCSSRLLQSHTYGGLLLGLAGSSGSNEGASSTVPVPARRSAIGRIWWSPSFIQPVLVPCMARTQVRTMSRTAALSDGEGEIAEHTDYRLPLVRCTGWLRCPQTVAPPPGLGVFDCSIAAIVWFQDTYTMPTAKEVLAMSAGCSTGIRKRVRCLGLDEQRCPSALRDISWFQESLTPCRSWERFPTMLRLHRAASVPRAMCRTRAACC